MKTKLIKLIEEYEYIYIYRHRNPDPDALGSQFALAKIIELNFKNKKVYQVHENDYERFSFLVPNSEFNFDMIDKALCIIVDTANAERIAGKNYTKGQTLFKIDHHPNFDKYAGVNEIIDVKASSTCEMIFDLIQSNNLIINNEIARLLYSGIMTDTGGFIFPNATSKTFEAVAKLIKYDFDREQINLELRSRKTNFVHFLSYVYKNITIENEVGYIKITKEIQEKFLITPQEASDAVNFLGIFAKLKTWVMFNEQPTFIRVNLRSKGQINVSAFAQKYGGGGHFHAAGARIENWSMSDDVIKALNEFAHN